MTLRLPVSGEVKDSAGQKNTVSFFVIYTNYFSSNFLFSSSISNYITKNKTSLELQSNFGPDAYNLIHKNCNHFANAFVMKLIGRPIPPHVNRLAHMGSYISCIFPKKMLEAAPVGDGDSSSGSGGGGSSGYQVYGGGVRSHNMNRMGGGGGNTAGNYTAFS